MTRPAATVECIEMLVGIVRADGDAFDCRWAAAALGPLAIGGAFEANESALLALSDMLVHSKFPLCRKACAESLGALEWRFDAQSKMAVNENHAHGLIAHLAGAVRVEAEDQVRAAIIEAMGVHAAANYAVAIAALETLVDDDVVWVADLATETLEDVRAD